MAGTAKGRSPQTSGSSTCCLNRAASTGRETLVSHSIDGSFAIRQGGWKLCLSAGSGGWSDPREPEARSQNLPAMQLYNLKADRGERKNLINEHPDQVVSLLRLLNTEVTQGRSTPGKPINNDREVTFLPQGIALPVAE